jgi:hypothetical protein
MMKLDAGDPQTFQIDQPASQINRLLGNGGWFEIVTQPHDSKYVD